MNMKPLAVGCFLLYVSLLSFAVYIVQPGEVPERIELREYPITQEENRPPEEPAEQEEPEVLDPAEVELIGRTIWGEAEGVTDMSERAAVAWCILNRVDTYDQTIEEVVTAPNQFHGYRTGGKCPQRHLDLAADVLTRWNAEKDGAKDVGRVLPVDYLYFIGDGERNHFSIEYQSTDFWDWSLINPYT